MKIFERSTDNPKISIIELRGNLTEETHVDLKKYLYVYLASRRRNILIDCQYMQSIDSDVIHFLGDISKSIHIHLFNVGPDIRWLIKRSGRYDVFKKVYDDLDEVKAVSLFAKRYQRENDLNDRHLIKGIILAVFLWKYLLNSIIFQIKIE